MSGENYSCNFYMMSQSVRTIICTLGFDLLGILLMLLHESLAWWVKIMWMYYILQDVYKAQSMQQQTTSRNM